MIFVQSVITSGHILCPDIERVYLFSELNEQQQKSERPPRITGIGEVQSPDPKFCPMMNGPEATSIQETLATRVKSLHVYMLGGSSWSKRGRHLEHDYHFDGSGSWCPKWAPKSPNRKWRRGSGQNPGSNFKEKKSDWCGDMWWLVGGLEHEFYKQPQ